MADGLSQSAIDNSLDASEQLLNAVKGLHRRDVSPFRTMSGADVDGVEPTKVLAAKVSKALWELEPNSSPPTPPL